MIAELDIDYCSALYGAIYGALLSLIFIWAGYKYERWCLFKSARRELIASLKFNRERADQMFRQFASGMTPNYNFDTTGLIIWTNRASEVLNEKIIKDLNWTRFQMDHANCQLNSFYVSIRLSEQGSNYRKNMKHQDISEVYGLLQTIQSGAQNLSEDIQKLKTIRFL